MFCDAAMIMASVSDLCRRSFIGVCRGGVCVSDLCPRRVSSKSVLQECQVSVPSKRVPEESQERASYKTVK